VGAWARLSGGSALISLTEGDEFEEALARAGIAVPPPAWRHSPQRRAESGGEEVECDLRI